MVLKGWRLIPHKRICSGKSDQVLHFYIFLAGAHDGGIPHVRNYLMKLEAEVVEFEVKSDVTAGTDTTFQELDYFVCGVNKPQTRQKQLKWKPELRIRKSALCADVKHETRETDMDEGRMWSQASAARGTGERKE
ncbi:hypothetical protein Tco_0824278 [Tanacetum coccineum]|uniref:Uncharacterized protein n=1 Tax=Tanacetum coccineum TaxID=301880 RepID=A0ABQ5AM26_9ASTR